MSIEDDIHDVERRVSEVDDKIDQVLRLVKMVSVSTMTDADFVRAVEDSALDSDAVIMRITRGLKLKGYVRDRYSDESLVYFEGPKQRPFPSILKSRYQDLVDVGLTLKAELDGTGVS